MTTDRWQRVSSICGAVLDHPPATRARLIRDACQGDDDLRREIESLVAHAETSVVIDREIWSMAAEVLEPEPLLTPGAHVGPYRIVGVIGAGGMGTVYRARDSRLERDVALKVLPAVFAENPDRLARFRREAHTLAALNHPNVAAIHGFEDAGDVHALVLELVDGRTLAERLRRGRISVREGVAIARGIAEALIAAHDMGIVHRDLKPANVKIRDDGTVKLLDFGLAKTMERAPSPAAVESGDDGAHADNGHQLLPQPSPTFTSVGAVMGTLAYMAPEQVHGRPADKRSDVWAFGCVLYELLSGHPAFQGADATSTRRAVLEDDPDWDALPRDVPRSVRTLIERCLKKDRPSRVGDMAVALYVLLEPAPSAVEAPASRDRRRVKPALFAAPAAVLVLALSVWAAITRDATPPRSTTWLIANPAASAPVTVSLGRDIDISPDGTLVVYDLDRGEESQIMVRPLDKSDPTPLPDSRRGNVPFFSWDGRKVGFAVQSEIRTVPVTGGRSTIVCQIVGIPPRGFSWGPDNRIYFATSDRATGVLAVPATGGDPVPVTSPDAAKGELDHWYPSALPNGRGVVFTIITAARGENRIGVLDLSTRQHRSLDIQGSHAVYAASGHLVYAAGTSLRAVPFDPDRLQVLGPSVAIDEGIPDPAVADPDFAVSRTGTLVYIGQVTPPQRSLVWVDRAGRETPIPAAPVRPYTSVRISPDGRRIAVGEGAGDAQASIFVVDLARQTFNQLNTERGRKTHPVWLDKDRLVFMADRDGPNNLYVQSADGSGRAERLTTGEWGHAPYSVAPNPLRVFFTELGIPVRADLGMVSVDARRTGLLFQTDEGEANPAVAPDGHWLAYQWNRGGSPPWHVFVVAFPQIEARKVSIAPGTQPAWTRGGRELMFINEQGRLSAVVVEVRGGRLIPGAPREVLKTAYFGGPLLNLRAYDVTEDGERFMMIKDLAAGTANIAVVQGWFAKLRQLANGN